MKVLVTGANGFLGSHIVRELLAKGYEVRAFILPHTSQDSLKGLVYEVYEGNLLEREDISKALDACDYVIHTAAITDVWPSKNQLSWQINYEVVKNLVGEIKKKPIRKMIHVGTANSFGFGSIDHPGNETCAYNGGKYGLDYMDSKKAAQDYLLSEAKRDTPFPVVIMNPTFMIGENDTKPGPGEMIISVMEGKVPGYAAGGRCFAAVKDVAQACVKAIEKGEIGECYITGGVNLCYRDFFRLIAKVANIRPPKLKIPTWLAILFASLMEWTAKLQKKKPKLTKTMAKISGDGHYYSSEKARRDLGYQESDLEIALREAVSWYRSHGYVS
ncbi:MAG: NAD-dependent epimerase/dehydratase family protein [Candidatus Izemoplasmatales bacterium]|jgi:dihydroflavonol-4-reductase